MAKRIRLNEAQLKQIIKEAVQTAIQQQASLQGQIQTQQPQRRNIEMVGRITKKESLPHAFIVTQVNGKVFVWKTDGKRGGWVKCVQGDVIYPNMELKFKSGSSLYAKSNDDGQEYYCDGSNPLGKTRLGRASIRIAK